MAAAARQGVFLSQCMLGDAPALWDTELDGWMDTGVGDGS